MIDITPAARTRIDGLVQAEVVREPALRITLESGTEKSPLARNYVISLVEKEDRERTEIAINVDEIRVFLNLDTSNLLSGATVDWVEENGNSGFRVSDPNATPAAPKREREPAELVISGPLAERVQEVIDEMINPGWQIH